MKKYFSSPEYRRFNRIHAQKSHKRALIFKKHKHKDKRREEGKNKRELAYLKSQYHTHRNYVLIETPTHFSIVENLTETTNFIQRVDECLAKNQKVYIKMERVEKINYDALVVLLSKMVEFKSKGVDFNGSFPENLEANMLIRNSGFFEAMKSGFKQRADYTFNENEHFYTHANYKVESKLTSEIINTNSKLLWGHNRRCPGVQRILIELMQNTNNHAADDKKSEKKHWWLSVNYDSKMKKLCFSFVDYGVGVFTSLIRKRREHRFYGIYIKIKRLLGLKNNAEVLEKILDGEFHKMSAEQRRKNIISELVPSSTGLAYRGRGLPALKDVLKRNQISNLFILTNDVFADVAKKRYEVIANQFNGTFVYFEVEISNDSLETV
jgi:hypothetical protein